MQIDSIRLLESLFAPPRKFLNGILTSLFNKDILGCRKLIDAHLKELRAKGVHLAPDLKSFALVCMLHKKALGNRLKAFGVNDKDKT